MSAATMPPSQAAEAFQAAAALPRKRFSRQEVDRLLEAGFFEGQRYELIDGDLIDKMGQNPPHASAIQLIVDLLVSLLGRGRVRCQSPMEVSDEDRERTLPEPDVVILCEAKPDFRKRHPRADEVLLVIEVSDTTTNFDLSRKTVLYAKAGVREYWVLDLNRRMLVVNREPDGSTYRLTKRFFEADTVSLEGGEVTVHMADILP